MSECMNILLEGIICREPADTKLQSSRSQTKNSLDNLKFVRWEGGGGGGGGGGGSFILKLLDHLIHSLV